MSDGILLIDKGFGLTSFETVQQVKKLTGAKRAGHAGTLDPYATGLLVVTLGRATKLTSFLMGTGKEYRARIRLGQNTETWDRFGRILDNHEVRVSLEEIENILGEYRGDFNQQIPPYSAVHVNGRRMYDLARRGEDIPDRFRTVQIYEIAILNFEIPMLEIEIKCGSGTYIRSIAYQLGRQLGCGGHLFSLARTASGPFRAEDSITLQQLKAVINMELFDEYLIPLEKVLAVPSLIIDAEKAAWIKNGRDVLSSDISHRQGEFMQGELIGIKDESGRLLAVGTALVSSDEIRPDAPETMKIFEYKRVI